MDGNYIPVDDAKISVLDFGFTRSDVTYDVAHVWGGNFFRLDDHLERFQRSMAALRLKPRENRDEMRAILIECVRRSGLRRAFVAMVCTRGRAPPGVRDPRQCINRFFCYAIPFVWLATPEKQKQGLNVAIGSKARIPARSIDPTVKNYHWLDMVMGLFEAYDRGAENVILLDLDGNVAEGPGFNVFMVADGKLATPDTGALEGITRRTVLELASELGIPAAARKIGAAEFRDADEVFVCSTAGGVMAVTRLDGRILGNGAPGPVTDRLQSLYWRKHGEGWHATPVNYD
ncbi:MAG: branched-chain amino acid transferase [Alphaproteobacteria bacterium]|nr:branched-chain amino acid transferase [Alphaproteobacteria bacterium]